MEQLTFNTRIGYDDIQKQFEYQAEKQRDTIKLLCNGKFGIVSNIATYNSDSPLCASIDSNLLNFKSGTLVTKSGNIVALNDFSVSIPPINQDTIVLYTYTLKGSKEKRLSNNGKAYSVTYIPESADKCISFLTEKDYSLLSSNVLDNSVCLAVLKYVSGDIIVDSTDSVYSFNRPWFSLCDIEHRNMLGSGSSSVPHSIGLNDLTSNDLTIYEQLITRGIIISKDLGIAGIPGTFYKNDKDFKVSIERVDDSGTLIKVVDLQDCYPNAIASVTTKDGFDVACHLIKGSNYLIIDDDTAEGTSLNIQMVVTNTLLPQVAGTQVNELLFKTQDPNDTIITQGLEVKLKSPEVSFSDCPDFNKNFEIVVNVDGTLHKEPEVVSPLQKLSKYETVYISQEFDVPVKLQVLRKGNSEHSDVILDFCGTDSNGNNIVESVEIKVDGDVFSFETKNYFKSIECIKNHFSKNDSQYSSRNLSIDNVSIIVFAYSNRALDRRTRILNLTWDGDTQSFKNLKDIRPISTIIRDPLKVNVVKEASNSVVNYLNAKNFDGTLHYEVSLVEDFSSPEYLDANTVTWITTGKGINFPLIPSYVADTSSYTLCYRSRKLKLINNTEESKQIRIFAYLVQPDLETVNSKPVRLILDNEEIILDSLGNGLFVTSKDVSSNTTIYGKVLVTGNALGISVFYT